MNVFFLLILSFLFTPGENDIPEKAKADFKSRYPSVTKVKWEKQGKLIEAEFRSGKEEMEVIYDSQGNWQYTVKELDRRLIPVPVIQGFRGGEFKDWKIDETGIARLEKNDSLYFIEVKKGREEYHLLLDGKGSLVKKMYCR